jgi:hypothetical protein
VRRGWEESVNWCEEREINGWEMGVRRGRGFTFSLLPKPATIGTSLLFGNNLITSANKSNMINKY